MKKYQLYAVHNGLPYGKLAIVTATSIEDAIEQGIRAYGIWKQWTMIAEEVA